MFFINKFNIKILIYLFLLLSLFCALYFDNKLKLIFKSRLDPSYWIYQIQFKEKNLKNSLINLIELSKNNPKYKEKALMNLIFYYDELNDNEKEKILAKI